MARYIDADKLTERIKVSPAFRNINDGLLLQRVVIDLLNNMPTADVVPKSEVERWRRNLEAVLEERAEERAEVAREIFEEVETCLEYEYMSYLKAYDYTLLTRIEELKKKYTEGKDEDKN